MGYWICPRCGSNDAFCGTEVVSGQQGGQAVVVETEFGFVGGRKDARTIHKAVSVMKCKGCGELLSDKDYFLTDEEIKQRELLESKAQTKKKSFWSCIMFLSLSLIFGVLSVVQFFIWGMKDEWNNNRYDQSPYLYLNTDLHKLLSGLFLVVFVVFFCCTINSIRKHSRMRRNI